MSENAILSEKLDVKQPTERLGGMYDLVSRVSTISCAPTGVNTTPTSIYKCGIMVVLKEVVFLRGPLYCCSSIRLSDI